MMRCTQSHVNRKVAAALRWQTGIHHAEAGGWRRRGSGAARVLLGSVAALLGWFSPRTLTAQQGTLPPFYRVVRSRAPVQSMIFGPTDLHGAPLPSSRPAVPVPSATLHCERDPLADALRNYAGLQLANLREANDLGILFRGAGGAPRPFVPGRVLLWRAGRLTTCRRGGGGAELVYGAEIVAGFLFSEGAESLPRSVKDLEAAMRGGRVLAVGAVLNGGHSPGGLATPERLEAAVDSLASGDLQGGLIERFRGVRGAWQKSGVADIELAALGVMTAPRSQ